MDVARARAPMWGSLAATARSRRRTAQPSRSPRVASRVVAALAAASVVSAGCAPGVRILRGRVLTLEPKAPTAEAIALSAGRVLAVGTLAAVRDAARATRLRVVEEDLGDATLVPGLTDAHGHLFSLGRKLAELDVSGARTYAELVARVAQAARSQPAGTWIRGRGWDQTRWPGGEFPHHGALSNAVPEHPVLLRRVDGHAALVNARAMAGRVDARTADPAGGRVLRDARGEPTGILVDNAMALVAAPPYSRAEIRAYLAAAMRACVSVGLASVHDMGMEPAILEVLREMARKGEVPLRVVVYLWAGDEAELGRALAAEPEVEPASDWRVLVRGVKLISDGAMGSRGAALLQPYADAPKERGHLLWTPEALRRAVKSIAGAGLQPAIHAIGDRAVSEVLGAYDALFTARAAVFPPRLEHAQLMPKGGPLRVARLAARGLGIAVSMQPVHLASDQRWVLARLGPERAARAYAWRTLLETGAPLAFGSDFPVEAPDPRLGLHAAVTRGDVEGRVAPFGAEEKLTREESLRAFTVGPALVAGLVHHGRLRAGAAADLTIFAGDLLKTPASKLPTLPILRVYVGGEEVFGK